MPPGGPNTKLFINYRREDTAPYAGRLYDRLTAHFGEDHVFIDIDQIDPGEDFVEVINGKVGSCDIAIVAIGPDWLTARDASGQRRLDDSEDFVRMEIVAALDRKIRVIPVLVGGARMPRKQDLPEALAPLSRRNAIEISETRFHSDVSRLIEAIEKPRAFTEQKAAPPPPPTVEPQAIQVRESIGPRSAPEPPKVIEKPPASTEQNAATSAEPAAIGVPESKDSHHASQAAAVFDLPANYGPSYMAKMMSRLVQTRPTKRLAYGGTGLALLLVALGLILYLRSMPREDRPPIPYQPKATSISAETPDVAPNVPALSSPTDSSPSTTDKAPVNTMVTSARPSAEEMKKTMEQMMELGKPGENHKLLADMAGNWSYTVKMWFDPSEEPQESKGSCTRKAIMDGRYFVTDQSGNLELPGADGKMMEVSFEGMAIEGYDNVKQKFVTAWIDNMGTMIMMSEGTYDAATKTFTYVADGEMLPGTNVKIREVIKVVDNNHHHFEWYQDRGQGETKTMEINYTRKKLPRTEQVPLSTRETTAPPSAANMEQVVEEMMELAKPGQNHKLLAELAGNWTYTMKIMMDPATGKQSESKGTAVRKAIMDGRYYVAEHTGKFQMLGPDGNVTDMDFKGMAVEGYDNVKKKFVSSWIDNMSTMIMNSEGGYDAANKTFIYNADCEIMPGVKTKMREVIKVVDKDHHTFEMYEDRGSGETKSMEIAYTRARKK